MHARAYAVGDIDEVSHNKGAGKNETIMIMRRAVCATATKDLGRRHSRSHGTKSYLSLSIICIRRWSHWTSREGEILKQDCNKIAREGIPQRLGLR